MALMTGILMFGKISVGVRRMLNTPNRTISIARTIKV